MNYIETIRKAIEGALPGIDSTLLDLYTLLALTRGTQTTLEDVHDAWAVWRNRTNPAHKSLIRFDALEPAVQELDRKYMDAIHAATITSAAS